MNFIFILALLINVTWAKSYVSQSFSAQFEESMISRALGKEKKSFGKIDYKYPGHIRFEVVSPNPSLFVSNNQKSWYYVPPFIEGEQGQLTIQKSSKLPLTKILDSMKNGIEQSKLFSHKYAGKEMTLTFNKTAQKETSLKEVVFHAKIEAKQVEKLSDFEKLSLYYLDGQKVDLRFIEFKPDTTFDSKHFEFVIPDKTKVIQN